MLQDDHSLNSNANYQQETGGGIGSSHQVQWRSSAEKIFSGDHHASNSANEFNKQISRSGFSLDSSQFSPHGSSSDSTVTCQSLPSTFQMDSTANLYGSPSTILQGLLSTDQNQQSSYDNRSINYQYGMNTNELLPSWSNNKVPQFLRTSPHGHGQLHFSNNAPFWNPSAAAAASMTDIRPAGFFPSLQAQFPTGSFDEKPKVKKKRRKT